MKTDQLSAACPCKDRIRQEYQLAAEQKRSSPAATLEVPSLDTERRRGRFSSMLHRSNKHGRALPSQRLQSPKPVISVPQFCAGQPSPSSGGCKLFSMLPVASSMAVATLHALEAMEPAMRSTVEDTQRIIEQPPAKSPAQVLCLGLLEESETDSAPAPASGSLRQQLRSLAEESQTDSLAPSVTLRTERGRASGRRPLSSIFLSDAALSAIGEDGEFMPYSDGNSNPNLRSSATSELFRLQLDTLLASPISAIFPRSPDDRCLSTSSKDIATLKTRLRQRRCTYASDGSSQSVFGSALEQNLEHEGDGTEPTSPDGQWAHGKRPGAGFARTATDRVYSIA